MTASTHSAEVVRELRPLDEGRIHGVTFDGSLVWFARDGELVAFDPQAERVVHRFAIPDANAGTAFDGEHLYQVARDDILVIRPSDGHVVRKLRGPRGGMLSGLAWADGHLWVGQIGDSKNHKIHKIDASTGEVVKSLSSDRFVTGVSCLDGVLWHATSYDGKPSELRRLASDGTVEEVLTVPVDGISGMERTRDDAFWCAGEKGRLRLVRRKTAGARTP
jgi:hypothetical protein